MRKGQRGTLAHQEFSEGVREAGGATVATNLTATELGLERKMTTIPGASGHPSKRGAAWRWRRGRRFQRWSQNDEGELQSMAATNHAAARVSAGGDEQREKKGVWADGRRGELDWDVSRPYPRAGARQGDSATAASCLPVAMDDWQKELQRAPRNFRKFCKLVLFHLKLREKQEFKGLSVKIKICKNDI